MNEFPMIRLELTGMKHSIMHAFNDHQLDMSAEVKRALDRECSPEKLQAYIDNETRAAVKEATESAVRYWWATSETGKKLIQKAIVERMEEEAKLWSKK